MTDSDFSPADAETNAAGLRQRLDDMEGWWGDRAPEPVRKAGSRAWSAGYELSRPKPPARRRKGRCTSRKSALRAQAVVSSRDEICLRARMNPGTYGMLRQVGAPDHNLPPIT